MAVEIILPTWPVVLSTALVDSINPCAIGVLVIMIATLLKLSNNRKKMLSIGIIYITTVFLTYLAAGFGLLTFILSRLDCGSHCNSNGFYRNKGLLLVWPGFLSPDS